MPSLKDVPRKCQFCNKDFLGTRYEVNKGGAKYCSRQCSKKRLSKEAIASKNALKIVTG